MYNPDQCSDSYCEWIEIYNPTNQSIDLSGWYLCDDILLEGYVDYQDGLVHSANGMLITSDGYALITDGGSGTLLYANFNASLDALPLHVNASSMCGGLDNSGEMITLSNESITIALLSSYSKPGLGESITYDSSWGANGNGYSLERINPSADPADAANWGESLTIGGSPGYQNTIYMLNLTTTSTTTSTSTSSTTTSSSTTSVTTSTTITLTSTTTSTLSTSSTTTTTPITSTSTTSTSTTTTTTSSSTTTSTTIHEEDFDFSNPQTKEAEIICKPDGIRNYAETGIDCGGPCGPCPETTVVTTSLITTILTTSVPATTTLTTAIATTTTIPSTPGIIGSVIALSWEWADEFSIAAILFLLSATGYAMKKGKGKKKG